jgi:exodeoxyribonuclease V alpha subunit
MHDVQILAPMHKGTAGVANLNVLQLQSALNPTSITTGARGPGAAARRISPGDKVIQLRNNYDKGLFNGDIGTVTAVGPRPARSTAEFDGARHTFDRGDLGDLALAYAISIHKSQGSEYPVVIVPLLKAHFMMLQRNLLYTAITRGKKKVFLVGEAGAVRDGRAQCRVEAAHHAPEFTAGPYRYLLFWNTAAFLPILVHGRGVRDGHGLVTRLNDA